MGGDRHAGRQAPRFSLLRERQPRQAVARGLGRGAAHPRAKYKAALGPNGDVTSEARQLGILRDRLNTELDRIAPRFREARGTAYRGFKAEDAYEAGENYVMMKPTGREAEALAKQIRAFSASDRVLFMHGFANTLIGRVGQVADNQNVINKIYNTPDARRRWPPGS